MASDEMSEVSTMFNRNRFQRRSFVAWLASVVVIACTGMLQADTVWTITSGPNAKPFERSKMKIDGMTGDGLLFRSAAQDRAAEPRPIKEIWRIQVDDEPALNAAETAFVESKWDDAVAGYQKALSATRKDWVKQYGTLRLLAAAEKSGKFSAAASAYAMLAQRDLKAAAGVKPAIPKDAKAEVSSAIEAVKNSLADRNLKPPVRATLQAFLTEMYIANGQLKEAEALGAKVAAAAPPAATGGTTGGVAAPNRGQVELKLQLAIASLKQKKYQETIDAINAVADAITEPDQQAEALFSLAEAKAGLAGEDPAKLKDAALAYMRVVAHFKAQSGAPHVAESLLRAGMMLEQAKLYPDALAAYQAVEKDYKDSPYAKDASAGVARVQPAAEKPQS